MASESSSHGSAGGWRLAVVASRGGRRVAREGLQRYALFTILVQHSFAYLALTALRSDPDCVRWLLVVLGSVIGVRRSGGGAAPPCSVRPVVVAECVRPARAASSVPRLATE